MEYPSEEDLKIIEKWDDLSDPKGWFDFIRDVWDCPEYGWDVKESDRFITYKMSTGGWSGNEDIVSAMSKSIMWPFTWEQSSRGGHFVFQIRR